MLLREDEIVLPETTPTCDDVVVIPLDKYEWMIRENATVDVLTSYLVTSKKPSISVVKSILKIPHN